MTLENIYYFFGILFYISWIALVGVLIFISWKTYKVIERAPEEIKQRITELLPTGKKELLSVAGMVATTFVINRVKTIFKR